METQKPAQTVQGAISLTADQLRELLIEVRRPIPTDKEIAEQKDALEARKANAALTLQILEQKKMNQQMCTHLRYDGTVRAVYVQNGDFLICQGCQDVIRRDRPELFNRLIQRTSPIQF